MVLPAAEESLAEVQAQMRALLAGYRRLGAEVNALEEHLWTQVSRPRNPTTPMSVNRQCLDPSHCP